VSTEPNIPPGAKPVAEPLTTKALTELLVKHYGLTEGLYDAMIEFRIGTGGIGPSPEVQVPGVIIGITGMGLVRVEKLGAGTVDAAVVNPRQAPSMKPPARRTRAKKAA